MKHTFSFEVQVTFREMLLLKLLSSVMVSKEKPNDIITHSCLASFDNDKTDKLVNVIEKAFQVIHITNYIFPR